MDTTELYIRKCRKAIKIQEQWKPQSGDYIVTFEDGILTFLYNGFVFKDPYNEMFAYTKNGVFYPINEADLKAKAIWLPRQDQSQDLIPNSFDHLCDALYRWTERGRNPITGEYLLEDFEFKSWEQLWFELVMFERYKKVWNSHEEWVNAIRS